MLITSLLCLVCVAIAHALSKSEQLHREQHDEYLPPQRRASRAPLRSLSTSDLPSLDAHTNVSPLSDQPPPPPPVILSDIDSPKQIQHVCSCFVIILFPFTLDIHVSAFNTVENQCIIQWFVCCWLCGAIGTTIRIHSCCGKINFSLCFPFLTLNYKIVAHGDGARVALRVVLRHPTLVAAITLLGLLLLF